jgi:hypothetical protein
VPADIAFAETPAQIARCYPVMLHLRPTLVEAEFVARIQTQQAEGFRLAFLEDGSGSVVAVAGFRVQHMLSSGLTLYVDDLVTDPTHRQAVALLTEVASSGVIL